MVGDFAKDEGLDFAIEATKFRIGHPDVQIVFLQTEQDRAQTKKYAAFLKAIENASISCSAR